MPSSRERKPHQKNLYDSHSTSQTTIANVVDSDLEESGREKDPFYYFGRFNKQRLHFFKLIIRVAGGSERW
jgi:hypothetical protein